MGNRCSQSKYQEDTRTIYSSTFTYFDEDGQPFNPNAKYASNRIKTTKYTVWNFLPLNLWEQFHRFANVYFVLILILNFMPGINAFAKEVAPIPVVITLSVIAIKDALEDFRRHLSDRRVNRRTCKVFSREAARYIDTTWEKLYPGDFVRLVTNEVIPADILLLKSSNVAGICHIETANLDGESNLKQREVVDRGTLHELFNPLQFNYTVEVEAPNAELYKFSGKINRPQSILPVRKNNMILRGCILRNTDFVEGMVIYAGRETKAALNNTGPRFKRSRLEKQINFDVVWCALILVIICFTTAIGNGVWQAYIPDHNVPFLPLEPNATTSSPAFQGFLTFWRSVILFQAIIPLPLYVSIEIIKLHQVWHMSNDLELYDPIVDRRVEVRTFNILEDLGQVQYVFCDKTGTLTENKMVFKKASINGVEYTVDAEPSQSPNLSQSETLESPNTIECFESLKNIVNEMSLLETQSNPRNARGFLDKSQQHIAFVKEFILILAICNTAVVSVTKNTATFFQMPTRRQGLKGFLLRKPRKPRLRHKRREGSSQTSSGTRRSKCLSILPTHKKRLGKVTGQGTPIDKKLESSGKKSPGSCYSIFDPPVVEITSLADDTKTANQSPDETGELETVLNRSVLDSLTQSTEPSVVPVLSSDLSVPNLLIEKPKKKARLKWKHVDSDVDNSGPESDSSNSRGSTTPVAVESSENGNTTVDQTDDNLSTRTLTLVAHDGSSYELPVSKDFIAETNDSKACPLSEKLLLDSYESESPDEVTLVKASCCQGCRLLQRGLDFVLLWLPMDGLVGIRVHNILPFDSVRKRMSIIIRHPTTDEIILYTKGADSSILNRVVCSNEDEEAVLARTRQHVEQFSRMGLRTLIMAKRVIPEELFENWSRQMAIAESTIGDSGNVFQNLVDQMERDFTLIGATGIEDRLQPGVPETIEHLREGGMHVWVLTGDKQETAVNVAHSVRLLTEEHKIIFINATSKAKTRYLIACNLHAILCGHRWSLEDSVNGVMSDDPEVESSSPSIESHYIYPTSQLVATEKLHNFEANGKTQYEDIERVKICNNKPEASERIVTQHKTGKRHAIQRTQSESRATRKRQKLRPRNMARHPNVAKQMESTNHGKFALVIDGETLQFALDDDLKLIFLRLASLCSSVLCCRSTPSQKAEVVKLVRDELSVQTLAIGDGANDVNMIQVANIGIGISGEEGMQAVMASDFAISRFRFLGRLLFVHGHSCYDKLAHTALYLFYKDAVYIFLLFWFQIFNGFSGSNAVDQLSQILFAITFTGLQPFLMGIWDNPADPVVLKNNPVLYRAGIEGKAYRPWLFWINIGDALWQSIVIFFVTYLFYADSPMTIWRFGNLQMNSLVLCSLLHAALVTRTWVYLHGVCLLISYFVAWLACTMLYHAFAINGIRPENPYNVIFMAMSEGGFWLLTVIIVTAALLPRFTFIAIKNTMKPGLNTIATLLARVYSPETRLPLETFAKSTARKEDVEIQERIASEVVSVTSGDYQQASLNNQNRQEPAVASSQAHSSLINLQRILQIKDHRRKVQRARTISLGSPRFSATAADRMAIRTANNFDDANDLPSIPAIWPVVDPTTRYHSLNTHRNAGVHRRTPINEFGSSVVVPSRQDTSQQPHREFYLSRDSPPLSYSHHREDSKSQPNRNLGENRR